MLLTQPCSLHLMLKPLHHQVSSQDPSLSLSHCRHPAAALIPTSQATPLPLSGITQSPSTVTLSGLQNRAASNRPKQPCIAVCAYSIWRCTHLGRPCIASGTCYVCCVVHVALPSLHNLQKVEAAALAHPFFPVHTCVLLWCTLQGEQKMSQLATSITRLNQHIVLYHLKSISCVSCMPLPSAPLGNNASHVLCHNLQVHTTIYHTGKQELCARAGASTVAPIR